MHKLILWSNLIDLYFTEEIGFRNDISLENEWFANEFSQIISDNYYKFLSINIIRCGAPNVNIINPIDNKPYLIKDEFLNLDTSIEVLKLRNFLQREYTVWNKFKNQFEKNGLNFIEIKQFFESDVIAYFKARTLIEYNEKDLVYFSTYSNQLSESSKLLSYAVRPLDSIIINI